jgi:hypothetical protein
MAQTLPAGEPGTLLGKSDTGRERAYTSSFRMRCLACRGESGIAKAAGFPQGILIREPKPTSMRWA